MRAAKFAIASTGSLAINTELRVTPNVQNALGGRKFNLNSVSSFGQTAITTVLLLSHSFIHSANNSFFKKDKRPFSFPFNFPKRDSKNNIFFSQPDRWHNEQ
jgi:hypothetical protein